MTHTISYKPIGTIRTPFKSIAGMPVQPSGAESIAGTIGIFLEFADGLKDINGFSHLILIYHFHQVKDYKLEVIPFMDDKPHGIFATRAPLRPNAVGISIVRLTSMNGSILHIMDVDMLDGTPLLDIKPFYPGYDNKTGVTFGWLEGKEDINITKVRSDNRFQ
jgi:tRNA-Thr(GGU) m(6)t(6)A37 methyltransferase TsaA